MISYALSMIPDWERAIDAALAALNPGGQLHIVDFGQQEGLPAGSAPCSAHGSQGSTSPRGPSCTLSCRPRRTRKRSADLQDDRRRLCLAGNYN
jgi:hypothetical protein